MPPEVYTSAEWFEFEKRAVWDREWICVGHVSHIPKVGDYTSITVNDDPLLVLRDADGVRVMSSVCQHRGHLLGDTAGNTTMFTCPFHGWSYDLQGKLVSAPEMKAHATLEELQKTHCLPSLRTEIWNGFIFMNLDGKAAPLEARLKRLSKEIENHHLGEMGGTPAVDWVGNPWNWKFMHENAIEPHHTWYLHKGPHDFAPSRLATFSEWDEADDGAIFHPTGFLYKDGNFPAGGTKVPYFQRAETGTHFWCACGRSQRQPYCDGSHKGTDVQPLKFEADEEKLVAYCGCKRTKTPPYCDGTHLNLK